MHGSRAGSGVTAGLALAIVAAVGACSAAPQDALEEGAAALASAALVCSPQNDDLEGRASPYDSTTVQVGEVAAKICYGRPAVRGRQVFGAEDALVPYGQLWRTGANEPTTVHLAGSVEIAGIPVDAGSYSLYTIPGEDEWTVIVNRSVTQWGYESLYSAEIEAQEVGRATVPSERLEDPIETFTIRPEPAVGRTGELVLEWARTRVRIPVTPAGG